MTAQNTTITKHAVKSPKVGMGRLFWFAVEGQQVDQGQAIARFNDGGKDHSITAPATGRLVITSKLSPNTSLQGGNVIGFVHEGEEGTKEEVYPASMLTVAPQKPTDTSLPQKASNPPQSTQSQSQPTLLPTVGVVEPPAPRARRNTHVEPLEVVLVTEPEKPAKSKKRRMVVRSFTISKGDDSYLIEAVRRLRKHANAPDEISESLLIRVGIAFLNSLSDEGIIKHLQSQIKAETKAGVGAGRRRRIQ